MKNRENTKYSMFRHVIIDQPERLSPSERDLVSLFYFLSDKVTDAYVVEMNEANWIDKEAGLYSSGYGRRWFPEDDKELVLRPNDELLYTPWSLYEPGWGMSSGCSFEVDGQFVYTKKKWVKDANLLKMGISSKTSILLLASAGLEFSLPRFSIREIKVDELEGIKEKLIEEREVYLAAISKLANESFDRISSGAYKDAVEWARNESEFHLNPKTIELEHSLSKMEQKVLKRLAINFIQDGVPAIGRALTVDGLKAATNLLAEEALKLFSTNLAKSIQYRRAPEASYCVKLKKAIEKKHPDKLKLR